MVQLLIRALAREVLVFVIGIEREALANSRQGARIERRAAPLLILALVEELAANIRGRLVRTQGDGALEFRSISVAPLESAVVPIQVRAITVGEQNLGRAALASNS